MKSRLQALIDPTIDTLLREKANEKTLTITAALEKAIVTWAFASEETVTEAHSAFYVNCYTDNPEA